MLPSVPLCDRRRRRMQFWAHSRAPAKAGSSVGRPKRIASYDRRYMEVYNCFGNYIPFYTESSWRMCLHCRRSCRSRRSRVCKFDPPPNPRLGGGFRRNPQGATVLDSRRCKGVYNRHCFLSAAPRFFPLGFGAGRKPFVPSLRRSRGFIRLRRSCGRNRRKRGIARSR